MNDKRMNSEYPGTQFGHGDLAETELGVEPLQDAALDAAGLDAAGLDAAGLADDEDTTRLRQDIEATQSRLSEDVAALTEEATPAAMARRGARNIGESLSTTKGRISEAAGGMGGMVAERAGEVGSKVAGTAGEVGSKVASKAGEVGHRVAGAAGEVGSKVSGAAGEARERMGEVGERMVAVGSASASGIRSGVSRVARTARATPGAVARGTRDNPLAVGLVMFGIGWLVGSLVPAGRRTREMSHQLIERATPMASEVADTARQRIAETVAPDDATVTRQSQQDKQSQQEDDQWYAQRPAGAGGGIR